ncbi:MULTISPECIES: C-terminal binding protein [unclassified Enterococcus]|uniref:C-terminal binding protein n=1 Tax=unclassified Enterococcus TaxID=2608891 RepID=UPI001557B6B7|nr:MULTISPECIES: C-terminal binding protein [unclassified Enterococcus]MBS7577140.1 C-terminal binding protein [Enterococcus sp. MMGLQ5-2]MBS7584413.1 C-terminal binding protein [Enterococcus sp. MMGLQ5-1]NPD12268.1 C-terminal binding protein [Enterococcus sp. MMGLQ5-1]NPD36974.1 C-terminal binding protein [Enterococcus sp. MMGLQ5-2]
MKYLISDYPDVLESRNIQVEIDELNRLDNQAVIEVYPYNNQMELNDKLKESDVLLTAFLPIDEALLANQSKLKGIAVNATGTDTIDKTAASAHQIRVSPLFNYSTEDVANQTLAFILLLNQKLKGHTENIEQGIWRYREVGNIQRLGAQTLGLIGFGKIAQAVNKRAQVFGMKVIAVDPFIDPELALANNVELVDLETIKARADVISLHLFANKENEKMLDWSFFSTLKRNPLIINVARGSLIDESALIRALDEGLIRGAGLDVLASEKPNLKAHPLLNRTNVQLTPHAAFYSEQSIEYLQKKTVANAVDIAWGR